MQRCLIIPVRLHAVSAAPYRNATNQHPEHEANCENNNGMCTVPGTTEYCTLCEAGQAGCTYMYMQSSFIDFSGWSIHGRVD